MKPKLWMLQETKLKNNEQISCEALKHYQVYYKNRQESNGGGVAMGVDKDIESTLIREGEDGVEAISVKIVMKEIEIRAITAYGPQENALKCQKDQFWEFIEEEVNNAELEGEGVIIQFDGNLHAGSELIKGDPNKQNQNGRLFCELLSRNPHLSAVNALDICEGIITRKRKIENKTEEAVLDFFIINDKMRPFIKKMVVDEQKEFTLINLAQVKKNNRLVETDHNAIIVEMEFETEINKQNREELFNLKSKSGQDAYFKETEKNEDLLQVFQTNLSFDIQSLKWKKILTNILQKCFNKIRVVKKKEGLKIEKLLKERVTLMKQRKLPNIDDMERQNIEEKIRLLEVNIGEDIINENHKEIVDTVKELGDGQEFNHLERRTLWKMLKKKFPKNLSAVPVAKKNKSGKIITDHKELKHLYLDTYIQRLRNRPIKQDFNEIKNIKEDLFNERLELSLKKKSEPWKMSNLEKVLKALKKDKARDPNGWSNELFMDGIAGSHLKASLLDFLNKMKEKNIIPDFVRLADVATIYKGKGSKNELINERGIFIVTIIRSILMKLIYSDFYKIVDKSMTDSQVGARKGKNIRNHIWIVNGVICDILSSKTKIPVDIQIFDYKQCFDSLWLQECLNDLYKAGLNDNKFALLYNANKIVDIAVKTPVGKTDRKSINNAITQGDVFSPIFCSKQVDTISKECLLKGYTYLYRNEVVIPPLTMIDDVLSISECGFKTTMVHAFIKTKTDEKKLQFGANKCKKMHVGKICQAFKCQTLKVDNWKEVSIVNEETGEEEIKDIIEGEEVMELKEEEKYLGDIISSDGRNIKNIKARVAKGKGTIIRIISILEGIPFGRYYYEVGIILRNSLLVSSMLVNTEAWYSITAAEMELLESVDVQFLRKLINAPRATPKEMLYLELGCTPFRELISKRRILFLHYILNQEKESMIRHFFEVQLKDPKQKDWVNTVRKDLEELKLGLNMEDIKNMKKSSLKRTLNKAILDKAMQRLNTLKENHSKVKGITHSKLKMQNYFKSNRHRISQEESQMIFKMRSRVTNVKMNYKGNYENLDCSVCNKENESQKHIIECSEILKHRKDMTKVIEYEKLFGENVRIQKEIVNCFMENMKMKSELEKN